MSPQTHGNMPVSAGLALAYLLSGAEDLNWVPDVSI